MAADPRLAASKDGALGVKWMSPLRSADLGSPVTAYNTQLNKTLVYVGDERGDVIAYDETNGATVWSTSIGFGDSERATPMVAADGSVWVATAYSSSLIKLDASDGKVLCSVKETVSFDASPMLARPPGGEPTIYIATNHLPLLSGPTIAVRESNCKTIWTFKKYLQLSGAWATTTYGVDKNGRGLVFEGTADPDSTLYALDAKTGTLVWDYSVLNPPVGASDIGAAATVSLPGNNGFADGVVYLASKYGIMYALDLTTGTLLWQYNFNKVAGVTEGGRSSSALSGNALVFGMANGVFALDAIKGTLLWHYIDPTKSEVISSPAILGPAGDQAVVFGDVAGTFHALRLTDGTQLYSYQTGGYITSSPASINGDILIDSTDGFLYAFTPGGGNTAPGSTAVVSPTQGSSVANPNGNVVVSGTAQDNAGLSSVVVSVQSGGQTGPWYNAGTGTWGPGVVDNAVVIKGTPKSANWTFSFPVPAAGATYQVFANAVDALGQADRTGAQPTFSVMPSTTQPTLTVSAVFVAPGSSLSVAANAFEPGEKVFFSLFGQRVATGTADSTGSVPALPVTVPVGGTFGLTPLTAIGKKSGKTTTAALDITNAWSAADYDADRTSYEPNDDVLLRTLQATKNGYVARAWFFNTGAAVNASPAIAAGDAFVGNDAGEMSAVDTISGAPLWTYTTPTKKPIHASPAVDVNAGNLVFGSDDGTLYTLALASGKLVGSLALNGIPTAPGIANGQIYVGTDAGTIADINEITGAVVWSVTLTAAIHTPPAIDAGTGIVVTGDDSGAITALNAKTGATVWTVKTQKAVTAAPAIDGGVVYAGSTDGNLYALDLASGARVFTFKAGAPILAGPALPPDQIVLGTGNGTLYDLTRTNGAITLENVTSKAPIVGVGAANGVPLATTSTGGLIAAKIDQGLRFVYTYQTGSGLSTAPTVIDGTVYVGAQDGGLYAFTPYGFAPLMTASMRTQNALLKSRPQQARWPGALAAHFPTLTSRSFEPFGQRIYPMHLDRSMNAGPSIGIRAHGGPVQTTPRSYVIDWSPAGSDPAPDLRVFSAAFGLGGTYAAGVVDRAPYPLHIDDAAVQREVQRMVTANGWPAGVNTQIFVFTGPARTASQATFCAYHSAFDVGATAVPVPYAYVPFTDAASGCGTLAPLVHRVQLEFRSDPLLNAYHDDRGNELNR